VGLLIGVGTACTTGTSSPVSSVEDAYATGSYQAFGVAEGVEATLFGDVSSPVASLALRIQNTTQEPLSVDLSQVSLFPEGGIKSTAELAGIVTLEPGNTFADTLPIRPIHQARTHLEYGWAGVPTWQYSLPLSFISSAEAEVREGSITLDLVGSVPEQVVAQLFQLSPDEAWMDEQRDHWQDLLGQLAQQLKLEAEATGEEFRLAFDPHTAPFVHASLPELSCGGVNLRLTSHQLGDSLYVGLRMVNHSYFTVSIPLAHLAGEWGRTSTTPVAVHLPRGMTGSDTGEYWLKKGQRMEATLVYPLPTDSEEFVLRLDQIQLKEVKVQAFHDGLLFERINVSM